MKENRIIWTIKSRGACNSEFLDSGSASLESWIEGCDAALCAAAVENDASHGNPASGLQSTKPKSQKMPALEPAVVNEPKTQQHHVASEGSATCPLIASKKWTAEEPCPRTWHIDERSHGKRKTALLRPGHEPRQWPGKPRSDKPVVRVKQGEAVKAHELWHALLENVRSVRLRAYCRLSEMRLAKGVRCNRSRRTRPANSRQTLRLHRSRRNVCTFCSRSPLVPTSSSIV